MKHSKCCPPRYDQMESVFFCQCCGRILDERGEPTRDRIIWLHDGPLAGMSRRLNDCGKTVLVTEVVDMPSGYHRYVQNEFGAWVYDREEER